jgi:hypothetical protein
VGDLIIKTPLGELIEKAPIVFQENKILASNWMIENNVISFNIKGIDSGRPFIIDPMVCTKIFGTYYGGNSGCTTNACAADKYGNVYITGSTSSSNGTTIATIGSYQSVISSSKDAFLVKFNADGVRKWGTYYGGNLITEARNIVIDNFDHIYIVGSTRSFSYIATPGSHQPNAGGNDDAFVAKFDLNGVRQWSTFYGGSGYEVGFGCSVDSIGNLYMSGHTSTPTYTVIASVGAHQISQSGTSYDAFLVKFNSSGVRQWGTYYGGAGNDRSFSCSTDKAGNIYMAGYTNTNTFVSPNAMYTSGAFMTLSASTYEGFLVKFNGNGVRQWGTYFGTGSADDYILSCATDNLNNIFITGSTASNAGMATTGIHQSVYGGANDAFVAKFDPAGVRLWCTYYGGALYDDGQSCKSDKYGNVYVSGTAKSTETNVIATAGSPQTTNAGFEDAFLAKFDGNGARIWGTYTGGSGADYGTGCATNNFDNVYVTGYIQNCTGSTLATNNCHQYVCPSGNTGFLLKFADCTIPSIPVNFTDTTMLLICPGNSTTLTAVGTGTVNWYSSATGGTPLGSGIDFVTPLVSDTTTFYAEDSTCYRSAGRIAITVNTIPAPILTIYANDTTICLGNYGQLSVSGADTYTWSNGINNMVPFYPITSKTYSVTGTDTITGCTTQKTQFIKVNPLPLIVANSTDSIICGGDSIKLFGSGGNTYTWSNGVINNAYFTPLSNITYTVYGTDLNGCLNSDDHTIIVNTLPTVIANSSASVICLGDSLKLFGSGTISYSWNNGVVNQQYFSPTSTNTYTVIGMDANNCMSMDQISVTVNLLPNILANLTQSVLCLGDSTMLSATGAVTYSLTGGIQNNTYFVPIATSNFTLSGTDINGCKNSTTVSVMVNPLPIVLISSSDSVICANETVTLTATGALTYAWNNGSFQSDITATPSITSIYSVTGSDANGCKNTFSYTQHVDPCAGLEEFDSEQFFIKIYPNPNTGYFNIQSNNEIKLAIYNSIGQYIIACQLNRFNNFSEKISGLSAGIYFINYHSSKNKNVVQKFIVTE